MQDGSQGLREKNRARTTRELHEAAAALVLEQGLSGATVEAIADRAGVSRRTFFNYFASKEDAVLGACPPALPEVELTRFLDDETDRFTRTVRLIVAILRSSFVDGATYERRRLLTHRCPELRERLSEHILAVEKLIRTALDRRADAGTATESADSTRALLMLAATVLRFVYSRDPEAMETDPEAAVDSAISIFKNALEDIS
ncbi:TetR/AcrR family transcriptional regulator [Melissospora conviva]|uniref:TetR/AcrR family transcriptional regulator n=1 Tax=Melissospora conviva TaxID=3388432 RepID=UPI003C148372